MKIYKLFITVIYLFLLLNCAGSNEDNESNQKHKTIKIKIITPKEISIQDKLTSLGSIIPFKEVSITPEVYGKVKKILVEEGKRIGKGQVLCIIDPQPFEMGVNKAKSDLAQSKSNLAHALASYKESLLAIEKKFYEIEKMQIHLNQTKLELNEKQRDFNNKKILFEKGGISEAVFKKIELEFEETKSKFQLMEKNLATEMIGFRDIDIKREIGLLPKTKKDKIEKLKEIRTRTEKAKLEIARSEYNKKKVELEEVRIMLSKCFIKSPLSGVVGLRKINEGEQVKGDTPIFILFTTNIVYGMFEINEADLHKVTRGIQVSVTADAYPGKTFKGIVDIISPLVSQKTRTSIIKVKMNNINRQLKPGMFIRGVFHPKHKRKVLVIPVKAVQSLKGDKGEVFIVKQNYTAKKKILLESEKVGDFYVIREGLKKDEKIVIESESPLSEGSEVVVVE